MLLCGWSPPTTPTASPAIGTVCPPTGAYGSAPEVRASELPCGDVRLPGEALAVSPWVWDGISVSSRVTAWLRPASPRSWRISPGPWPGCMGADPWRFGRAKFDLPSPPYVVPSNENSAVFCDSGSSWPLQNAQPLG